MVQRNVAEGCLDEVPTVWKRILAFHVLSCKSDHLAVIHWYTNNCAVVVRTNFSLAAKQSTRALYELVNRARLDRGTRHFDICAEYNGRLSHQARSTRGLTDDQRGPTDVCQLCTKQTPHPPSTARPTR